MSTTPVEKEIQVPTNFYQVVVVVLIGLLGVLAICLCPFIQFHYGVALFLLQAVFGGCALLVSLLLAAGLFTGHESSIGD